MEQELDPETRGRRVIRFIEPRLTDDHRLILLEWAEQLLSIRRSDASVVEKARSAIRETYQREVVLALLAGSGSAIKDLAWDDRSWSGRLGIGAATITAAAVGGQAAGIAALGGAVGVPLWIVLGAGGSFASMLIDELSGALPERARRPSMGDAAHTESGGESPGPAGVDPEWEVLDPDLAADLLDDLRDGSLLPLLRAGDGPADPTPDPLWKVFRSAYREARRKQGVDPPREE